MTCAISPCSWCSSPATPGSLLLRGLSQRSSRRSTATSAGTTRRARHTDSGRSSNRVSWSVPASASAHRALPSLGGGRHRRRARRPPRPLPHHDVRLGRPKGMFPKAEADAAAARLAHELEHRPPPTRRRTPLAPRPLSPSRRPRILPPPVPKGLTAPMDILSLILWPIKWVIEADPGRLPLHVDVDRPRPRRRRHLGALDRRARASWCARR